MMPAWLPGWVGADIGHPDIQGDQDPPGCGGSGDNVPVGCAGEAFGADGVNVVTGAGEDGR
jgi:hypothetical protein